MCVEVDILKVLNCAHFLHQKDNSMPFVFSGRCWAATTTEGLLIYSLDHNLVFDPFHLDMEITPSSVKSTLEKGEYSAALMLSFRLNEQSLIQMVTESIPPRDSKWYHDFASFLRV